MTRTNFSFQQHRSFANTMSQGLSGETPREHLLGDDKRLTKLDADHRRVLDVFHRTLAYFSCERTASSIFLSIIVNLIQRLQVRID